MNDSVPSDAVEQRIRASMIEATLQAIRTAVFHNSNMVIRIDGQIQTIRPEQHPLYNKAMQKDTLPSP